jgi:hypothetical protein
MVTDGLSEGSLVHIPIPAYTRYVPFPVQETREHGVTNCESGAIVFLIGKGPEAGISACATWTHGRA